MALQPRNHRDVHAIRLGDCGQRFAGSPALDGFSALIIAQLATEFDASGLREPPKWLDKASTVCKTMSGERQNTPQTAR
jgi:hypothetical protein